MNGELVSHSTSCTNQILIQMKKKPKSLKEICKKWTTEDLSKGLAKGKQVVHDGLDVVTFATLIHSQRC